MTEATGTGFVIAPGLILTSASVLSNNSSALDLQVKYTPREVVRLHGEIDYWRSVRNFLAANCDPYVGQVVTLYGSNSAPYLQPSVPWDWYRRHSSSHGSATDDLWLGGAWWSRFVAHDTRLPSLYCLLPAEDVFSLVDGRAPGGVKQYPFCGDRQLRVREGAYEGLLRFVGGIIAALSFVLVLVLAALSRRINATNLVLLLIAACQRFGHRDEPDDDTSLLARRQQSLLGTVPAM